MKSYFKVTTCFNASCTTPLTYDIRSTELFFTFYLFTNFHVFEQIMNVGMHPYNVIFYEMQSNMKNAMVMENLYLKNIPN